MLKASSEFNYHYQQVGYDLESSLTHDYLDPYLAALTFGGKASPEAPGNLLGKASPEAPGIIAKLVQRLQVL